MIRTVLLTLALCCLTVPSLAATGDTTRPALAPFDAATATYNDCGTALHETTMAFSVVRIQYPVDNEWYYFSIEQHVSFSPNGMLNLQDIRNKIKSSDSVSDAADYVTVRLTDLDPATVTLATATPFDPLLSAGALGAEQAADAAQHAVYVVPGWYPATQKPSTSSQFWTVTVSCRGKKPLAVREHQEGSTAPEPFKSTILPPVGVFRIFFTDKPAAEQTVKVLRRMILLAAALPPEAE